jgi:murein DD-endopeptidase MepM/ murein hydrolase activator NlpD
MAAIAAGCSSVSELIEKLGRGELSVIASDAVQFDPISASAAAPQIPSPQSTQHIHIHPPAATAETLDDEDAPIASGATFPKLVLTGVCAAMIVGSLLYIGDRILTLTANLFDPRENIEDIVTPLTGEVVAGYEVSDEYGIRPVHPVTGEANAMHNGVDLATPIGTPIYAVGKAGDRVTVECWWDVDGGGQVVDQIAESYPGYVFQSLHISEKGCQAGEAKAGEVVAYSGNSGLGTGAHYDFRVKIDGEYVPPATKYLESAMTGKPPKE